MVGMASASVRGCGTFLAGGGGGGGLSPRTHKWGVWPVLV